MMGKIWERTNLTLNIKPPRVDVMPSGKVSCERVQIFVRVPSHKSISLLLEPFDKIATIKEKIEGTERFPCARQSLYFSGELLDDRETLFRYNIRNHSTLYLRLWDEVTPSVPVSTETVPIFVKLPSNKSVPLLVKLFDKVATIKEKIEEKELFPRARQWLYFSGKLLDDTETLATYEISKDSTLHLMLDDLCQTEMLKLVSVVQEEKEKLQRYLEELQSEFPKQLSLVLDEKDKLQTLLNDVQNEFPRQLALALDEKFKLEQHFIELQNEFVQMSLVLDENAKLKRDHIGLQKQLDNLQIELGQEKERRLCNICFDKPRDTLVFSCLHLHFCSECLAKHQTRTNTCPSCRSFISGKLICNLSLS